MLPKCCESTEVERTTWLHVPSETHWSTSSETHQGVEILKETSTNMYTPFWNVPRIAGNPVYWSDHKLTDRPHDFDLEISAVYAYERYNYTNANIMLWKCNIFVKVACFSGVKIDSRNANNNLRLSRCSVGRTTTVQIRCYGGFFFSLENFLNSGFVRLSEFLIYERVDMSKWYDTIVSFYYIMQLNFPRLFAKLQIRNFLHGHIVSKVTNCDK